MVDEKEGSEWTFVIDTDEYAGNFEREMCAYITGRVGECGVGAKMAEIARKELDTETQEIFDDIVASVADENGCCRPATIWPNPGWFNDGMGSHWRNDDKDVKKHLAAYVKSVEDYETPHMKRKEEILKELQAGKTVSNWTISAANREIKKHQKNIADAKKLKKVSRYPAYLSVGIWFHEKPSDEIIALMKKRAIQFQEAKRQNKRFSWDDKFKLNIEGFRLIRHLKSQQIFNI